MKTIRREVEDIVLVHLAVAVFVCVAFLTSALSSGIISGPAVDLGPSVRHFDTVSYPYTR